MNKTTIVWITCGVVTVFSLALADHFVFDESDKPSVGIVNPSKGLLPQYKPESNTLTAAIAYNNWQDVNKNKKWDKGDTVVVVSFLKNNSKEPVKLIAISNPQLKLKNVVIDKKLEPNESYLASNKFVLSGDRSKDRVVEVYSYKGSKINGSVSLSVVVDGVKTIGKSGDY